MAARAKQHTANNITSKDAGVESKSICVVLVEHVGSPSCFHYFSFIISFNESTTVVAVCSAKPRVGQSVKIMNPIQITTPNPSRQVSSQVAHRSPLNHTDKNLLYV